MAQGSALFKERNTIASIDISERKFWLRTTDETSITHQKSLAVSNLTTALSTTGKKLPSTTQHRRLGHLGLDNLGKLKSCTTSTTFDDIFEGSQDCIGESHSSTTQMPYIRPSYLTVRKRTHRHLGTSTHQVTLRESLPAHRHRRLHSPSQSILYEAQMGTSRQLRRVRKLWAEYLR